MLNNRDLNMVIWELRALGGIPKIEETQNLLDGDREAAHAMWRSFKELVS